MGDTVSSLKEEIQLHTLENAGVESKNVLQILNREVKSHLTESDDTRMHRGKDGMIGFSLRHLPRCVYLP